MVFPKILYHHRIFICGTPGLAPDLVASTYVMGMEDRTHNRNPRSQLVLVPGHNGIHAYSQ